MVEAQYKLGYLYSQGWASDATMVKPRAGIAVRPSEMIPARCMAWPCCTTKAAASRATMPRPRASTAGLRRATSRSRFMVWRRCARMAAACRATKRAPPNSYAAPPTRATTFAQNSLGVAYTMAEGVPSDFVQAA